MEDVEVSWDVVAAEEEDMVLAPMVAASLAMVESTPLLHTLLAVMPIPTPTAATPMMLRTMAQLRLATSHLGTMEDLLLAR